MAIAFHVGEEVAGTLTVRELRHDINANWEYLAECQACGNGRWYSSRSLKRMKSCKSCRDTGVGKKAKYPILDDDGRTTIPLLVYMAREGMTGDPRDRISRWNSANREPRDYKTREWILHGKSTKSKQDKVLDHLLNRWIQKVVSDTTKKYQTDRLYFEAVRASFGKEFRKEFRSFLRYELQLLRAEESAGSEQSPEPMDESALESFLIPVDPDDLD